MRFFFVGSPTAVPSVFRHVLEVFPFPDEMADKEFAGDGDADLLEWMDQFV